MFQVQPSFEIPSVDGELTLAKQQTYNEHLGLALSEGLGLAANRLNKSLPKDGSEAMTGNLSGTTAGFSGAVSALQFLTPNNVSSVTLASTDNPAIFGQIAGNNLAIGRATIQSRLNGAANTLGINPLGGNVTIAATSGSSILDLSSAGSSQIKFGNANLSADTATLDFYLESTWTPTFTATVGAFGAITYDAVTFGSLTRIGNRVLFEGRIRTDVVNVGTAAGQVTISGLPYSSSQVAAVTIGFVGTWTNTPINAFLSGTTIFLYKRATTTAADGTLAATADMVVGAVADQNDIIFSGSYPV